MDMALWNQFSLAKVGAGTAGLGMVTLALEADVLFPFISACGPSLNHRL